MQSKIPSFNVGDRVGTSVSKVARLSLRENPWIIIILVLAILPEGMPVRVAGRTPNVSFFDFLLIAIVTWLIVREFLGKSAFSGDKTVSVLFSLYFLATLISFLFGMYDPPRSVWAIKVMVFSYFSYMVTRSLVHSFGARNKVAFGLILFGCIVAMILAYMFFFSWAEILTENPYGGKGEISYGGLRNNTLAGLLSPVVSFALVSLFCSAFKRAALWIFPTILVAAGLMITFSRAGIAAAALATLGGLNSVRRVTPWWRPMIACCVLVLLAWIILPTSLVEGNYTFLQEKAQLGDQGRTQIWAASWQAFTDYPVLGVGPGCVYKYNMQVSDAVQHSHNYVLNSLADVGLAGTIPYLALYGVVLYRAWRFTKLKLPPAETAFSAALFAAILAMLIHGLVEPTFVIQQHSSIFWILAGLVPILVPVGRQRLSVMPGKKP